jgi:hypothetical protein
MRLYCSVKWNYLVLDLFRREGQQSVAGILAAVFQLEIFLLDAAQVPFFANVIAPKLVPRWVNFLFFI